jgi:hypothetical protein
MLTEHETDLYLQRINRMYLFLLHILQNQNVHRSKAAKYLSTKNKLQRMHYHIPRFLSLH